MNLISFSIRTKGVHNFARRLWTVFARFGVTERQTQRALHTIIDTLRAYNSAPTFFIPAVVLNRHPALIAAINSGGAEVGVHGYVHNDYRTLSAEEQYRQTERAVSVFQQTHIPHLGFRNPYLGWTEESLQVFETLGFLYESNEAVIHDVIDLDKLSPLIRSGYEKSLALFQAIPCSIYSLRPHFEGKLLRIPTCIPDDEMLFDRLRMEAGEVGRTWSKIMQRVYDLEGLYTLNLHPERGLLCKQALDVLLSHASTRPLPVWKARLQDIAQWWEERNQFSMDITPVASERWRVEVTCTHRATLLARHLTVEDQPVSPWFGADDRISLQRHSFFIHAERCPCIGLSPDTAPQMAQFLHEQGYPTRYCAPEEASLYALYLDIPGGAGTSREEQREQRSKIVARIEQLDEPLLHFGCWPEGNRAALTISGDIDSVTVQDFFLRILEVH
ncbi:MAG TPA: polysaccharide deacetylase family protein [Ktedonobacteraceae bacterium]|nr:polysaccharide deacetylase family protein [Ktedonobacteraceae bacterium]